MNPLWIEYPDIPWGSIGWRMGGGEAYWAQWQGFYLGLDVQGRSRYRTEWPEPEGWIGLYECIEKGIAAPWAVERRRKLQGPYPLPDAAELSIDDYFRIVWLIRNHPNRLKYNDVSARFPSPISGPR